ncbi:magnesium transporter [Chroococcidiopsis sp. CCNUC1]|jgi:magnesium transporter|uniref:magnesium transporter n=1 Tax=Chroococcidiopsis sp. CCNUC1 TaxID=2653189 RepID=UPI0020226EEE|nr:magnesium transporter [Chroococcidiopsis sp. CCNUC1]URD49042.1 magnesium transporter [Chroococcidiopsis sp. CCNUC1]
MQNQNSPSLPANISRQELQEIVRSQLLVLLEQEDLRLAKALLVPVQPVDIAAVITELPAVKQAIAFRLLSKDEAIEVYEYLDSNVQQALIEEFKQQDVLDIVDKMSPDDRARLFDELPAKVVRRLLNQLSPTERQATTLLLGYKPDTAGRIMTPEYIALKESLTVAQALERVRRLADVTETIYYLYVTDEFRHLTGVLTLRALLTAGSEQTVADVMKREVVVVRTDTDREEVARIVQDYDFGALPVVDTEQRLVGIITVDDVLDVIEQETTEDIYALGGVESGGDKYFQTTNLFQIARMRVKWLFILLFANTATSAVIANQEEIIERVVALAAFIPLLIDAGGNVGAQSSTVVIRGLNLREVSVKKALSVITRESLVGLLLGVMLGLAVVVWAYFLENSWEVAIAVGVSLLAITLLASVSGSALPFLFSKLSLDPALMSAPFITSVVDVLGVSIYLWVARVVLQL